MGFFDSIGSFFGGNGNTASSNSSQNSTTVRSPWAPTIAPLTADLSSLQNLYSGGAPQISPLEQAGYNQLQQTASQPDPSLMAAQKENAATASGQYLTPETNPYLAEIAKTTGGNAMNQVATTFGSSGRSDSGLSGYYAGQGVANAENNLYGQEYNTERGLQQNAVAQAPTLDAASYIAPQAQISAGENVSARPFDIANQYSGILSNIANLGGTSNSNSTASSTSTPASNGWLLNTLFPAPK